MKFFQRTEIFVECGAWQWENSQKRFEEKVENGPRKRGGGEIQFNSLNIIIR